MVNPQRSTITWLPGPVTFVLLLAVPALLAMESFLLFHLVAEVFSAGVAFGIFFVAWNTRHHVGNSFFLSLGVLYLYVGGIDVMHALAYKGMGAIDGNDANLATQLWIGGRFIEAGGLLASFLLVRRRVSGWVPHAVFGGSTILLSLALFFGAFPPAYVEGVGLTAFKIVGEYLVVLAFLGAAVLAVIERDTFARKGFDFLVAMFAFKILSEFVFTTYAGVYDSANLLGHLLKIAAAYMVYRATIKAVLNDPLDLLFRDLDTARQNLAESEARFRLAIRPAPASVFSLDPELRFTWIYNPHILGLDDDVIGHRVKDVIADDEAVRLVSLCRHSLRVGAGMREQVVLPRDGEAATFDLTLELNRSGGAPGLVGTAIDISEVTDARAEAERANEAKSRFLAAASHDLRQPFQAMRLFHHLLDSKLDDDGAKAVSRKLAEAMAAGEELLNALLDISTLEAGRLAVNAREVRLGEVMRQVAAELEPQVQQKGLALRFVPCSRTVFTDPVLLARILRNLGTNAIRYTRTGRILLGCRRSGNKLRIELWDTGAGIAPDKLGRIFDDFYRVAETENEAKGLGLGLAIVARLAKLLDIEIAVRSWPGQGSVFALLLDPPAHGGAPSIADPDQGWGAVYPTGREAAVSET